MKKTLSIAILLIFLMITTGCNSNEKFSLSAAQEEPTGEKALMKAEMAADAAGESGQVLTVANPVVFNGYDSASGVTAEFRYSYTDAADIYTVYNAYLELYVSGVMTKESLLQVDSIQYATGTVTIDFTKSVYSLNLEKSAEISFLQNLAEAYISNIQEVNSVYITVAGGAYESETLSLPADDPLVEKDGD